MGKNVKKVISLVLVFAMILTGMTFTGFDAKAADAANDTSATAEYEIYPTPRSVVYQDSSFTLADKTNVVYDSTIDEATQKRLNEVLAIQNITGTVTGAVASNGMNVLVGTKGSDGAVEKWFNDHVTYADDLFDKRDAYVLAIQDNVIAVLGKDTDAAFYGLSSLKMIFNQVTEKAVRKLQIEDYASGQYRGFIEGYYGIPWSVEDRISLMKFGGDFKMNMYIYAPKDEPYHNSQWRELYPADRLEEIRQMVQAGQDSKCRFAWAIHPFMHSAITASTYDADLKVIIAKFEQLYNVGVRQFVLSADDAAGKVSLHARLCKDLDAWCKSKGDVYNLCFVPQVYCAGAVNWSSWSEGEAQTVANYFKHFESLPDVELMWTGESVCYPARQSTFNNFKNSYTNGREAFMWLNWPVNDVNHARLVMGPGDSAILEKGLTNFMGIVTNPLEQAEASKTALFAIADFAWNTADFDAEKSWADGFKYIDSGAPQSLHELCKHMTNPSPGGITAMGESVELTPYINAFKTAYNSNADLTESGNALIEQLQKIVTAADDFQTNGTNENLKEEMKPWVDSLRYLSKASIGFVKTAMGLKAGDDDAVCANYVSAENNYKLSQNCAAPQLNGTIMAEAGAMKIMPFAAQMENYVKKAALKVLDNTFSGGNTSGGGTETGEKRLMYSGLGGFYQGNAGNVIDGNDSTFAWFNASVTANGYIGLDLGAAYKLGKVRILQGRTQTDGDIFSQGILEYSMDNENWTQVDGTYGTNEINVDLTNQSLKARYIRLRTPAATSKWYAIREFQAETFPADEYAYTNTETYKETIVTINKNEAAIPEVKDVILKNGEYIGIDFGNVREISTIAADYTNKDKVTFEYSYNGFNWYPVDTEKGMDAKYIRFINKGEADVTFDINSVSLTNTDADKTIFAEPAGVEGFDAKQAIDNSLTTMFRAGEGAGTLTYRLDAGVKDSLYVIQDGEEISNAKVSIHTNAGKWVEVGTLSKSLNVFKNLVFYNGINEVKITWDGTGAAPAIYEMYTKESDSTAESALTDAISAAKELDEDQYTAESYAVLKAAIKAAEAVAAKENATVEEKAAAVKALDDAIAELVKRENQPADDGYKKLLPANMTGAADSEELTGEGAGNGIIAAALDGDSSTYWHTNWNDNSKPKAQYSNGTLTGNNNYTITLDKAYAVKALTYLPRPERDKNGVIKNGAVTEANVYVSTDNGETYTKVANVTWSYEGETIPTEKSVEFEPVAGVTNVKFEAIHSEGAEPNMFINAAELNVLAKFVEAPKEENVLEAPEITVTAPAAGETSADAVVSSSKEGKHFEAVADQAADPATLTLNDNVQVSYSDGWGYSGYVTAENDGTNNGKFDVSGEDKAMFIRFRMKSDEITGSGTYQMLGKMDEQYGVQLKSSGVLVYACDAKGSWVESSFAFDSSFCNKWHDILAVITGTKMQIYVDGKAGTPTSGRANASDNYDVTLKSYNTSTFTTGYNISKDLGSSTTPPYTGLLSDIRIYSGKDYSDNLQKSYAVTAHALDQATPSVNIALTPYTTSTTWYKDGKEVEAGAAFEANANYEVKTVLTAVGDYRFADSSKPQSIKLSDGTSVKPEVNVAADYRSMTVSYSFKTEEVPCTCEITDLVFDNQTIQMAAADTSKTLKLAAKATAADCAAHEKNITYTYTLVDAGTTKAALEGDVLTVSAAGTAKVKVVAELNGKTAEKEITVTVTSDKATEASRTELGNTVNNAKAIDKTLYTEDSVKALETAITNAEAVLAKENASETEVAAAKKAVQDAIDALQKKDTVDKDKEEAQKALSDAVTKADAVYAAGQGQYTKESWDAFEKAYKAAKEAGADLTAAALKDLTAALEKAQAALKTAETPDTEPNPTPTPAEKKLAAPTIKSVKASAAKAGVVVKVIVNAVEGADHYDIYRTVNGKTVLAGSTASGKLVFKDKKAASLKGIKRASYRAVAVSKDANVKASDNGAAKTVKFTANVKIKKAAASGKSVKLSWKRNKKATGYVIYRSTKKNSGYKRIKKINNNKTVSYQDKKIRKKGNYYYKIVTVKKGNASAMSTAKKVKVK